MYRTTEDSLVVSEDAELDRHKGTRLSFNNTSVVASCRVSVWVEKVSTTRTKDPLSAHGSPRFDSVSPLEYPIHNFQPPVCFDMDGRVRGT